MNLCIEGFSDVSVNYKKNETTNLEELLAENPDTSFYQQLLADFKTQAARTKV